VSADVTAQKSSVNAANAGMDYSSAQYWSNATLAASLNNGSLSTARLDDMVIRNIIGYYQYKQDEGYPAYIGPDALVDVRGNHSLLARSYASDSIVLLKNINNTLPLKNLTTVSIFGYRK
jgi:beta-glucosidase